MRAALVDIVVFRVCGFVLCVLGKWHGLFGGVTEKCYNASQVYYYII